MFSDVVTCELEALRRRLKMDMRIKMSGKATGGSIKILVLTCVLMLQGCGGGAGGTPSIGVVAPTVAQPPVVPENTLAQPEAVNTVAAPGWTEPTGVLLTDVTNVAKWGFNTQLTTTWVPGSVSALTYADSSKAIALNFDFGCNTTVITTRTADCRNVVAMYSNLATPIAATSNSLIALKVRNTDIGAEYALRIRDSGGQTLQYPFQVRTIEQQNSSQWSLVRIPLKYPSMYWGGANDGRLNGSIVQISIVAVPRNSDSARTGLNYPKGVFELKSAQLFANAGTTYQLNVNAPVDATGLLPSLDGRLVVAHGSFDLTQLRKAKEAGFTAIRRDLLWDSVERTGRYVFDDFSAGASNLADLRMKVLWILDYGHPDHGGPVPITSDDLSSYTRFVQAAVEFGKTLPVMGYEVWNEPNMSGTWPNPDPAAYANLLNATTTAIRQYDANVPIVSGGVAIDEPSYLFQLAKTGVLSRVSAVGIHPYRKDTMVVTSPSFRRAHSSPEMYANDRMVTKSYLVSQGVNAPMWNTESGYSTVFFLDPVQYPDTHSMSARDRQGVLILRSVLTQISLNEPVITVYRLMDKGVSATDKEMNFGLLDAAGGEKPAFIGLKTLHNFTKGKLFNGRHTDVPPGMHALRWSDSLTAARTICMWADNPGENVSVTLPSGVKTVVNWKGESIPAKAGEVHVLTESGGPIYVSF